MVDLRHTGNNFAADTGAKMKDLMARAGHSSYKAQLIYQHPTLEQQRRIAEAIDTEVREQRNAQQSPESEAKEA